jgi:hypothetical protein
MGDVVQDLLESFAENQVGARNALRQMAEVDAKGLRSSALPVLKNGCDTPAHAYLVTVLLKHNLLLDALCDPAQFTLEQAVALARFATASGVALPNHLGRHLNELLARGKGQHISRTLRVLEILAEVSYGAHIVPIRDELLRHADVRVRSKAALLMTRIRKDGRAGKLLLDADPRVRASYVEALWGVDDEECRVALWAASKDPDNRVMANALLGLYRLQEIGSILLLLRMATRPEPLFQASAVWAMGKTEDPRFSSVLARLLATGEGSVRRNALCSLASIRRRSNACTQAGRLHVSAFDMQDLPDGSRKLEVALAARQLHGSVPPTQFVIREGSETIADYKIVERPPPGTLVAGFAAPRIVDPQDPLRLAVEQALIALLHYKRDSDLWRLVPYLPQKEEAAATQEPAAEEDAEALKIDPAFQKRFRFSHEPALLEQLIRSLGVSRTVAGGFPAAVKTLMDAAHVLTGNGHLILIGTSSGPDLLQDDGQMRKLAELARTESIMIHALAPPASPDAAALRELSTSTGGGFLQATSIQEIGPLLQDIYGKLLNRYEITWRPVKQADPAAIKVEVWCAAGHGEATVTSTR